jgi:hypothetical protein
MLNEAQKKQIVREKYSEIALQDKALNASSCCGAKPKIKVNMADLAAGVNACNPQSGCC